MRKAAAILVVLAVAMIVPVVSIAGACGPKPPCCKASASDEVRITRESCCAASCASSTVEAREGTTASLIQRVEIQMVAIASVDSQPATSESVDRIAAHSAAPPSLNRRLATLSLLII